MKSEAIRLLKELHFTEYEAKVYIALLEKSPLTGYAAALESGVPRSKVYAVLATLAERGDIVVNQGETPFYSPVPPAEVVARHKERAEKIYNSAETTLDGFCASRQNREAIWNIAGRDSIMNKVREAIRGAQRRVLLEIWSEDAEELAGELREADARGVEVVLVSYGEINLDFAVVHRHDADSKITEEYGGRWIVLSSDDREVVAGIVSLGVDSRAAWTAHPGLVMPITEVIVHDLYLMEILRHFRPQLEKMFGKNLSGLRDKFTIDQSGRKLYNEPK